MHIMYNVSSSGAVHVVVSSLALANFLQNDYFFRGRGQNGTRDRENRFGGNLLPNANPLKWSRRRSFSGLFIPLSLSNPLSHFSPFAAR